jgi:hypothetical protein
MTAKRRKDSPRAITRCSYCGNGPSAKGGAVVLINGDLSHRSCHEDFMSYLTVFGECEDEQSEEAADAHD